TLRARTCSPTAGWSLNGKQATGASGKRLGTDDRDLPAHRSCTGRCVITIATRPPNCRALDPRQGGAAGTDADCPHDNRSHALAPPFPRLAGPCPAPADVFRRLRQRAAGDAVVGVVAGRHPLGSVDDAGACGSRRLAACLPDAVPGAAQLHLRLSADRVSPLDGPARPAALALPAGGRGLDGRATGDPAGRGRLAGRTDRGPVDGAGRLDLGTVHTGPAAGR